MELGQYELQIFISLVVILGAASVALICDFLKGNNERLRELAIELNVRREVEERRSPPRVEAAAARHFEAAAPAARKEAVKREVPVERPAAVRKEVPALPAPVAMPVVKPAAKIAAPTEALVVKAPPAVKKPSGPTKDWQSLLARSSVKMVPNAASRALRIEKVAAVAARPERAPATGFQDAAALGRMIREGRPVSGLVVSIGAAGARRGGGAMPDAVLKLIQSLIGRDELACASGEDEFLLICPKERGAEAQRRMSQIAQQLWDFQLRSLGTLSGLFSWGGLEVKDEAFEEAMNLARERMRETRRGRKGLSPKLLEMEPRRLRAAV